MRGHKQLTKTGKGENDGDGNVAFSCSRIGSVSRKLGSSLSSP